MARIQEEVIVIKLSKLVKNSEEAAEGLAADDTVAALEQVVQELVGDSIVVEVEKA